ncbi:phospholipid-binding lipoprotein MlaA [Enhydrobacter aerosaccus]|uniref:Phospholipid-binding lipoprotein MlaA n=1 Tax=Enhydrobacter aerosaccus TaxID=225324 RepID=A0A1T4MT40_9HYPH|nr:VacJ family lipoprotein [Enhydrobacter aerosaccus]SJZ69984.1 phospholipid-binding lipoprotein MlaA [Enhydrobacter aerosaccus]
MGQGFLKAAAGHLRRSAVLAVAAAALVGGCATKDTGAEDVWDPLETPNRFIFSINRAVDTIALRPVAVLYRDTVPDPAQKGVHNAVTNLGEPITALNEAVQGKAHRAATTMARFLINSTIGVAGLFDVAKSMGLEPSKNDAGLTIGYYAGVEPENGGFYIMLPLLGPSNVRDAAGLVADGSLDPFGIAIYSIWGSTPYWIYAGSRVGATVVDTRVRTMYALDDLEKNSVDYYAALRSAYTQQRAEQIRQKRSPDAKAELERRDNLALVR